MSRTDGGLARQYALMLAGFFIAFELLMAAAAVGLLMVPMARRAAGDLAGLMVLSAQTWAELPPQTRPAFEEELTRNHLLALRADLPAQNAERLHGPYLYFVEQALAEKTGSPRHFVSDEVDGQPWCWTMLPSGDGLIAVGLPHDRVGTQPLYALLLSLLVALLMAVAAAFWLARRAVGPLARLEQAVMRVGRGESPGRVPEDGPHELATLARRFNDMAAQVRELLAARTTLLAGMSHDLRTPLARMRVALAVLEARPSPKVFARLDADIEEMDRLIGNVLDLARGLATEAPASVDMAAMLGLLAGSDARISVNCPEMVVSAPPVSLQRAVANLLENAKRYAPHAAIELHAVRDPAAVRIGVLDRGPGIPPEEISRVFEPFHRLDAARSPTTGGAGLGLAIVRQLANTNGWQIELKARAGGGLEAWLTLPDRVASGPAQGP